MKKMYSLKTLTRKMQSFVAIMLMTLMAVGNVVAQTGTTTPAPATLPYFVNFDDATDSGLVITNGNYTNKWMVGQAQGFDNNKLFISSSEGVTNKYNISQSSTVKVSREIVIPATGANISFDYRVNGEEGKDYLKVDLVRESGTITLATLQGVNEWNVFNYVIEPQYAGNATIVFTWINDNANGEQYPAAIDNISIVPALCAQIGTLQINVDSSSAHLFWTLIDSTQTNWEVQYKLKSHTDWYTMTVTTPELTLTDLQGSSSYDVRVRAICGENTSAWITNEFTIPCKNSRVDNIVAVEGNTPTNLMPFNTGSKYSWNEMILTAEEMGGPGIIDAITFNCAAPNSTMTLSSLKIYMANTDRTAHTTTTNWTPQADLTLVYEGTNVQIGGAATVTFNLATPFNYTGENLALVVSKSAGSAVAALTFNTDTARTGAALYRAGAGTAYGNYPANASSGALFAGTLGMMLPNITFSSTVCEDLTTCPDLADLNVDSITTSTAMVIWTKGSEDQNNFLLQYKAADATEWIDVQVQDTVYTLTGLDHSTQYVVRVKAICGENDESNYTDEVTFETPNPCDMVTNIAISQMSTTTTISWTAGGTETAWQVRFRPTTPEGEDYVIVNVSGIATTTIGGLPGNTEYEYGIKALCDDNESYWAEGTFTTGCDAKDFNYTTEFNTTTKPECWDAIGFDFTADGAVTEEAAWLVSPAMNVPATGEAFVAFDVMGGAYTLRASYRGTAQNRFATIYEGTASEELQHVIVPIPEQYMDKAVNFAFVSDGNLQITNVEFSTCAYIPSELTVVKSRVSDMDLQWLANGATAFVLEYSTDGNTWTAVEVEGGNDTVNYTLSNLSGDTEYQFRVKSVCSGNLSDHYSNVATGKTFCDPLSVPYTADFSSMPACWETAYTGTNATTLVTTQNNKLVMYNFGTSSQAQIDQVGDLYVILPSFDTTLNRLQLSFKAAKYNSSISSKFYLGVITDINDPSTFYQLNAYNLTSTEATETLYMLNQIDESLNNGYLAFRMKATDATASQAVVFSDVTVDFIPSCAKPMNLKVVDNSITANSLQLTWTQPTNTQNWRVKYGPTGFNVETEGTEISANMIPRTVANLTFGNTYDFYVRAYCSSTNQSEWAGPVTAEIDVPYIMGKDKNVTTCMATIYDNGGKTGNYTNNVHQYMVINPVDPTTTVTRLQGDYDLENNYDFVYIYDGTDTNQNPVRTLTGTGALDVTSNSGPLTLVMTSDASTVKSGFAFTATCEAAPSCSAPKNLSYFNNNLNWSAGVYGTPQSYEIRYRNTQTTAFQTTTSTTTSKTIAGLTVGDVYEFKVRSICGEGDTSEWVTSNIVIPCALKTIPYAENFDNYTSSATSSSAPTGYPNHNMPDCWSFPVMSATTSTYPQIFLTSYSSYIVSGKCLFFKSSKNEPSYAVLPAFDADIATLLLSYTYRNEGVSAANGTLVVGYMSNPMDPTTFVGLDTCEQTTILTSKKFGYNQRGISGSNYFMAFKYVNGTSQNMYLSIDNVSVDYIPECGVPEIDLSGSLLTITPGSSLNDPQSYELMIGDRTLNIGNVNSYDLATIPNLASNTDYTVKVRAICSSTSNSGWSNEVSYTTPCIAQEVPYTEDFDSYLTQATATSAPTTSTSYPGAPAYPNHELPDCWIFPGMFMGTTTTQSTSYPQVFLTSGTSHTVSGNALYLKGYNKNTYAVLPAMAADLNNLKVTLTYRNGGTATSYGALSVGYMTDYNDPATFVQVEEFAKTTTKTEKTVSFANVPASANDAHIVFKLASATGSSNGVSIDNVSVNYIACEDLVTNLTAEVTNGTATVTWQGSASTYDLEYGPAGFDLGQGTRVTGLSTTSYTISAVTGSYDVYVRSNCGAGTVGPWALTNACGKVSLPYSEHFDSYVAAPTSAATPGTLPPCYDFDFSGTTTATTDYGPKVSRYSSYSPYGSVANNPYLLMVSGAGANYGGANNPTCVILPSFALTLDRLSVSLSARISNATNGKLQLGYVSNDQFTTLTEITCATSGNATPAVRTYNLDQYTNIPADARLAFQLPYTGTSTSGTVYVGIDDILIEELPFCVTPEIASVSTTANSATVVISPSSNAQSYEVKLTSTEDGTVFTGTANTSNYTATVTGLSDNTTYIVTARAICSSTESSDWSRTVECKTKCLPLSLPYSENFNNYNVTVTSYTAPTGYPDQIMPDCWSFLHMSDNTSAYPQMFLTAYSSYAVSGNCLFLKSSKDSAAYAILPAFNHPLSQTQLSFSYRNEGVSTSNGTLHVGYMSDINDASTFVPVKTFDQTTTITSTNVMFNNTGISSSNYYIAFKYEGGTANNYYLSIDNVEVDIIPYCAAPEIGAVVCSTYSADVYVANNSDAQSYEVIAVLAGEDPNTYTGTPIVADGTRHAVITGLSPKTKYDFYARIVCDATTTSPWSLATSAMTQCAPIDVPYTTGFEDDGNLDNETFGTHPMTYCWNKLNTNLTGSSNYYPYSYNTSYSRTGDRCLTFSAYYNPTVTTNNYGDNYAILPEFNVSSVSKLRVNFYARKYYDYNYYSAKLDVGVMTDPNDVTTFVKVAEASPVSATYVEYSIPLNNYTGTGKYIAIRALKPTAISSGNTSTYEYNYVCLDDITVDLIPYCDAPMIDSVTHTDNTITAYIAESSDARVYEAVCVPAGGDVNGEDVISASIDSNRVAVFTGLNAATLYDVYVRVLCDSITTGPWGAPTQVRTECGPYNLPYTTSFEDDGTLNTVTFGSNPVPYCWNKLNSSTTKTYPYAYNSSSYARTGTRSLYFYNYMTTLTSVGDNYAVLPEFNVDSVKKLRVKFYARESSSTVYYVSHLEVGVMTNPDSINTFVKVADVYPTTLTHEAFNVLMSSYTGNGKYIAIKAPKPTDTIPGQTSHYNVTYLDDITVDIIPDCFEIDGVEVVEVSDTTVKVKVFDGLNQGTYRVEYRPEDATTWQGVTVSDTVITVGGLQPYTSYVLRAQAVCDSVHSGAWSDEVTVFTNCIGGNITTIGDGTSASYSYGPYNNYYKYTWDENIFTKDEVGGGGIIRNLSRKVVSTNATYTMDTLRIYMGVTTLDYFHYTSDWAPMENLTLVYEGTDVAVGREKGWETFELQTPYAYNGTDNLVIVTAKKASSYSTTPTYEYTVLTEHRNYYRYSDNDESYAEHMSVSPSSGAYVSYNRPNTRFMLCPYDDDLAIDSIAPITDACDLSAANVTVRVVNKSHVNSVSNFVMTCQLDGTEFTITDSVSRTLLPQESFLYTFNQSIPFVDGSNNVTVSVLYDLDENPADNTITLNDVRLVTPATVPYYQDFSTNINFGRDAWVNDKANNNPNMWIQEENMMKYYDSDTVDAQAYFITSCIEIPAGQYRLSYDYNAMSNLPENMNVYIGTTQDITTMVPVGQHQNFVKTETDQTYEYIFNNAEDGVFYVAVEALSQRGNMGITFDNLNIVPIVEVTVSVRPDAQGNANGTVSPAGVNYVVYGDDLSISMIPDEMYHVAGIWVDGERVMNEDQYNASFMLYTLENITEAHSVEVFFKLEFHINKIAVNANPEYEVGGYFIPAEADTLLDPNAHTVYFAAEPHNHFVNLVVGYQPPVDGDYVYGDDVTADVVYDEATDTYSYTLDTLLVANYYVQAMFRKDTVNINYTALAGDGVFDGITVAQGENQDTWIDYGTDITASILPADGFYTMGVTVNGEDQGIIDHYDFDSVITTQYVTAQFGHMVTATIMNINNNEYLGSDEVRGTIAPDTQMVVHGNSCSVAGTIQEHFHLSNFFVNGVDMLADVNWDGFNFSYTIDSLIANTEINAVVRIDSIAIYYTVDGGNGYVNGNLLEAPALDTAYVEYGSDFLSQFAAAEGYHIVNVTVNGTAYDEIPVWLTEFITMPQYITVTFALNEYDITTAAHGNGSVTPGVHVVYDPQSSYTFIATPAEGYHISQIMRNNESLVITDPESAYTETISPVLSDYNYVAYFAPNIYTVTATCGANGTIDPYGAQSYEYGATPTYTVTANTGYAIEHVYVDGTEVTLTNGTYTFAALTADHTITATFTEDNYTITASAGNGGTIDPNGATLVPAGSSQTYTITPAVGYEINDVTVDNVSMGALTSYTFDNVSSNHTIAATFSALQFTITATAGANGTITPAGVSTVAYGATPTYTVAANTGYEVDYVTVDGQNVTLTNGAYTFPAVTENHEIFAAFKVKSYTITVTDPANGTITPNGVVTVNHGATPTFTIAPATGYEVTAITVNGTNVIASAVMDVTGAYTYTFPAVTANRTLTATMAKKHFTITATAGANGTITGSSSVEYGDNATFTITPNAGYLVDNVTVDGISMGAISAYTFFNVTANHTINATFKAEVCVIPTALHVDNVDSTSATLLWYHPSADAYDIQYKALDANTWTLVPNVPGFAYNLTNLTPNTYYMFQVKAKCSTTSSSDWANAVTFKTLVGPGVTPGVSDYVKSHVNVYAEHNRVHIVNDYNVDIDNVSIYDMYGKLIYSGNAINNPEVIELNVAVGTYVVRLNTQQGPAVYKVHINR